MICSQLCVRFRFITPVQDASEQKPHWLQVMAIGRRPKATFIRIAVLVTVCFVTFKYVLLPIRIEGISMEPRLKNGQINFVNCLAYWNHEPRRGDIVSVRFAGHRVMLMKRVIALPGETLQFRNGQVWIDGRRLEEPYLQTPCDWSSDPISCGTNQYYVVGDNRSMQFELHTKGRADRDRIIGRSLL